MAGIFYLGLAASTGGAGLVVLVLVITPYVVFERRNRQAWRKLATRRVGRGGPYRRTLLTEAALRAPWMVRAAALSCFLLGVGCLPASAIAVSMMAGGDIVGVALLVPALVLLRLWVAGMRLLEPDVDSLRSVRDAVRVLVHVSFPLALASIPLSLFFVGFPVLAREGVALVLALGMFSLVCLAECALLARATTAAARLMPDEAGDRVRAALTIPEWMHRVIARKLVSQ